jgi:formimidoylglutamate deiminase
MYRVANRLTPDDMYDIARMAYLEMMLAGITAVGEFHYVHHAPDGTRYEDPNLIAHQLIRAAKDVGIRIVLLRTAYERAGCDKPPNALQQRFLFRSVHEFIADTEALLATGAAVGIALHSVRALSIESLITIAQHAHARALPIHMHVAEQPAEVEDCLAEHGCRPVELLHRIGILGEDFTAVHGIHITEQEAEDLGVAYANVCACPTTERNLGDGPVAADLLMSAGARVCFGTDSNAQIDILEDARCLEYHLRMQKLRRAILAPQNLLRAATEHGARSLGLTPDPGDYFTLDLEHPSLAGLRPASSAEELIFGTDKSAIRDVFVGGKHVVADGRHPDQCEIISRFRDVQARLWT